MKRLSIVPIACFLLFSATCLQEKIEKKHGKKTTVLRLEIDEIASGLSFMPEGLEKDLTLQDLADLLTFVRGTSQQRELLHENDSQS